MHSSKDYEEKAPAPGKICQALEPSLRNLHPTLSYWLTESEAACCSSNSCFNCLSRAWRKISRSANVMYPRMPSSETAIRIPPTTTLLVVEGIQCAPDGCVVIANGEMATQMP